MSTSQKTIELSDQDVKSVLDFTIGLARRAGSLILEGSEALASAASKSGTEPGEKKNSVDLVTEYDVRVEELVKKEIEQEYPDFAFIGEESFSAQKASDSVIITEAPTFCVDPIDGTTNFVHGFPYVAISLGFIYQRRPMIGVIYNPFLDHLYYGSEGQGSYLIRNGSNPLRLPLCAPKPLPSLGEALIAIEWGSMRTLPGLKNKSDSFMRLAADPKGGPGIGTPGGRMAHSLRSVGSAALNISLVAQGGLDMYWEIGCWAWDVCAGIVIAQEAGCVVVGGKSSLPSSLTSRSKLADVNEADFRVTPEILVGQKYFFLRPIEGGHTEQARIIRDFYDTVEDVDLA